MSHSQIEEVLHKALEDTDGATLTRNAKVANMEVDILQARNGKTVAFEIKTSNFFDGLGRAMAWKGSVDSVYLLVPEKILPSEQIMNEIPSHIGVVAIEHENDKLKFHLVKKAPVEFPTQILERDFFFEHSTVHPMEKHTTASLVSPKALRILRYILMHERTTQIKIAQEANVSIGMVNKVVSRLAERDIVAYKKRTLVLLEPYRLLNEVSWERPLSKLKIRDIYVPFVKDAHETENYLKNACTQHKIRYALTLFSAANRYSAYSMRYDTVYSYIEPAGGISEFMEQSVGSTEKGMRIELFRADTPDILEEAGILDGFSVCSPTQVLIDLSSYGETGKDVAVELYRQLSSRK
jgi:Holliday junction resolvase-like predicted endonuclease